MIGLLMPPAAFDLLAQVGKGLRVVVLPVVLARHDLPHLKGGLHRPVQRRCVVHWDSFLSECASFEA